LIEGVRGKPLPKRGRGTLAVRRYTVEGETPIEGEGAKKWVFKVSEVHRER